MLGLRTMPRGRLTAKALVRGRDTVLGTHKVAGHDVQHAPAVTRATNAGRPNPCMRADQPNR